MKTVKIKYCDFWNHWNENDNFIINTLKKKYNVEISENPDYIFFSNFNEEFQHMDYNDCVKIFYTQENIVPDFNYADYGIGYDNISFQDRYLNFPIYLIPERYGKYWDLMKVKHLVKNDSEMLDRGFCSFVVSNADADEIRRDTFERLCKYKKVDSGGKYLNNIGLTDGVADKLDFSKKYKFSLCFENTSHPGYTTEKIIEAFAAQTVPIYWGDPEISKLFNQKAFINVTNCKSVGEILKRVEEIDSDDLKYLEMLKAPALNTNISDSYWEEKQKEFEKFLSSIFDQEKENAIRRNMKFWGAEYHRRYYEMRTVFLEKKYSFSKRSIDFLRRVKHVISRSVRTK